MRRAAIVSDVRGGDYFDELLAVLDQLEEGWTRRCSSSRPTRRRSPTASRRPAAAIRWRPRADARRASAPSARSSARCASAPTWSWTPATSPGAMLRRRESPRTCSAPRTRAGKLALTLLTFGFKNGPPREADLMLDVRFLPNPHYGEDLRPLTGLDEEVRRVRRGQRPWRGEFYGRLMPLLDFLLPAYVAEGKTHLTIAIGCTGGRHRSVTVADRIAAAPGGRDDVIAATSSTGTSSSGSASAAR